MRIRFLLLLFVVCAPFAMAADPAEISFWESVRDSRDAGELRAYLERYPNGDFAVLARRRITTLESAGSRPAPQQQPATTSSASVRPPAPEVAWTLPKPGDTWTYRLSTVRRFGELKREPDHSVVVKVGAASPGDIVDLVAIDGGAQSETKHVTGSQLITQGGAAVFSPYLQLLGAVPAIGSIGRVRIEDPACLGSRYVCEARGRVVGKETVRVAAGTFAASKILIEQSWRSPGATAYGGSGGRTLTVWYAPEVKRVVKYASRTTFGVTPPIEPDFDLELVSYKVN